MNIEVNKLPSGDAIIRLTGNYNDKQRLQNAKSEYCKNCPLFQGENKTGGYSGRSGIIAKCTGFKEPEDINIPLDNVSASFEWRLPLHDFKDVIANRAKCGIPSSVINPDSKIRYVTYPI